MKISKFYGDQVFCFFGGYFGVLNLMKTRPNMTDATEYSRSTIHKITGKNGLKFCKLREIMLINVPWFV